MDTRRFIAPRSDSFVDWSDAYARVESYFFALRIQNRLLLSQLVALVLSRASKRLTADANLRPTVAAMEEANRVVEDWFEDVLEAAGVDTSEVASRGRLALFLADLPTRWQNEFLQAGPWPSAFLSAIRSSYLRTGPEFRKTSMTPRDIDLGPVSAVAGETWRVIDRWPIIGALLVWASYIGVIGLILYLLH